MLRTGSVLCFIVPWAILLAASAAQADIFQWEYINPADPSQGKQQSMTLAPDGAGVVAVPGAAIFNRDMTGAYLIGADLTGADGSGVNLTGADLSHANLSYAKLANADFYLATLTGANLAGADVRQASLSRTTGFTAAQLYSTGSYQSRDLTGIYLTNNIMPGLSLAGQNLTDAQFISVEMNGADLTGANLTGVRFGQVTLTGADLRGATFSGTFFAGATLTNADLRDADLSGSSFYTATMTGAKLEGADVRDTGFEASNITLAQLYSTASYQARDLTGIRLGLTSLPGAQFSGVDFTGAWLNEATLSNANLGQANLTDAQFTVATLTGANLAGSIVRWAYFDNTTGFTKEQLYSTASYQNRDLAGITLDHNELTSWNFANQNLNQASFVRATLRNTDFRQADLSKADFTYATMTGANLLGADVRGADFRSDPSDIIGISAAQLYSTASYQGRDLAGINLSGNNMVGWNFFGQNLNSAFLQASLNNADFRQANLTNANFGGPAGNFLAGASLIDADFSGAEVRGASFGNTTGFTLAQLYSTASYQAHDLTGVRFDANFAVDGFNFEGADFAGQNLTDAGFQNARLGGADFSGAVVRGAHFGSTVEIGFTAAQLYSTASHQAHDFAGIRLPNNNLSGWNFAGQNLTGANLSFANLSNADLSQANLANAFFVPSSGTLAGADLSGADARGSDLNDFVLEESNTRNLIRANGHIAGLDLTAGALLVVRDYDGNPATSPPIGPLPIVVDQGLAIDASGTMLLVFDSEPWDSTISFEAGIPVELGGKLELTFAPEVNLVSQFGRTIDLFDWAGVSPSGAFTLSSTYAWDVSKLYTTGEVTLTTAMAGDINLDGAVNNLDVNAVSTYWGTAGPAGDANGDGIVDIFDVNLISANWGATGSAGGSEFGANAVPEPSAWLLAVIGLAVGVAVGRPRRGPIR